MFIMMTLFVSLIHFYSLPSNVLCITSTGGSFYRIQNSVDYIAATTEKTKSMKKYENLHYTMCFKGRSSVECLTLCDATEEYGDYKVNKVLMIGSMCYCVHRKGRNTLSDVFRGIGHATKAVFFKKQNQNKVR